jgi:cell division protein FtsA
MNAPIAPAFARLIGTGPWGRGSPFGVLDVGTAKLCCYIVRPRSSRGLQLLGRGYQLAEGLKAGEIVDADAAEASILAALHEAEQQAGEVLREIVVAVSGGRPQSSYVRVALDLHGRAVSASDAALLLDRARRAVATPEREVVHAVPLEITIDDGRPLRDPCGMSGQKLEIVAHLVTVSGPVLRNVLACLERCHVTAKGAVCASYAAGFACLAEDEIERGCLVLDLGGGTTGLAHFAGGGLVLVDQVPYGGDHVSGDLAYGLSTSRAHAERIKNLYGSVQFRACDDSTRIEVPQLGDHADLPTGEVARTRVTEIVRARVEEILQLVQERLREHEELLDARPPRSLVLTGGGSQVEGIEDLAQELFGLPARRGRPSALHNATGREDSPCCAAATGAVGLTLGDDGGLGWSQQVEVSFLSNRLARLGQWFKENF